MEESKQPKKLQSFNFTKKDANNMAHEIVGGNGGGGGILDLGPLLTAGGQGGGGVSQSVGIDLQEPMLNRTHQSLILNGLGGGRQNVHMSGGLEHRLSLGGAPSKLDAVLSQDSDSEEDERDKKFAVPPAYYKKFVASHEVMAPPDLESLQKKDYFILYQQQRQVKLGNVGFDTQCDETGEAEMKANQEMVNDEDDKDEMIIDEDDGDHLKQISAIEEAQMAGSSNQGSLGVATAPLDSSTAQQKVVTDLQGQQTLVPNKTPLNQVVPQQHLLQSYEGLHGSLLKYLELQITGADQETLQSHSKTLQGHIEELNAFISHLRQMEARQLLARRLQEAIKRRDQCSDDMQSQITECQTYLKEQLDREAAQAVADEDNNDSVQ